MTIHHPGSAASRWRAIGCLLDRIERGRRAVDASLTHPERWRGPLRRELTGPPVPVERARVAAAFDGLLDEARAGRPLDEKRLLSINADVTRREGYRTGPVRVGPVTGTAWIHLPHPRLHDMSALVREALTRAFDGAEEPALAAARLHLELLLIHPFRDGNGRTARLASTWVLVRAGFRSRLLTAVEQHFTLMPADYPLAFHRLAESGARDHPSWLSAALQAMAINVSRSSAEAKVQAYEPRRRGSGTLGSAEILGQATRCLTRATRGHHAGPACLGVVGYGSFALFQSQRRRRDCSMVARRWREADPQDVIKR